jgi:hypothetical protein
MRAVSDARHAATAPCRFGFASGAVFCQDNADMSTLKDLKLAQKSAARQQQLVAEIAGLVQDIERSEKTISILQGELAEANQRHPSPRTTRQDIAYLTELLRVANKKLAWEKQIASIQKRAPALLERMSELMEDPDHPPSDQVQAEVVRALHALQTSMERLTSAKTS